jgi:hypothetical protein
LKVCSTARIQYEQTTGHDFLSSSGNWAFDDDTRGFAPGARYVPTGRATPQLLGLALLLAVPSVSSGQEPRFDVQRHRSPLTMTTTFQTSSRRRISPLEARKMALAILHRAEAERAAAAQAEAERGIDWEDPV